MNQNLLGSLGLAANAKKIVFGELLFQKISDDKIRVVLICHDMSEKQKSNLINKCTNHNVPYFLLDEDMDSKVISSKIGKANIKALGFEDVNFSRLIKQKF